MREFLKQTALGFTFLALLVLVIVLIRPWSNDETLAERTSELERKTEIQELHNEFGRE